MPSMLEAGGEVCRGVCVCVECYYWHKQLRCGGHTVISVFGEFKVILSYTKTPGRPGLHDVERVLQHATSCTGCNW